MKHPIEWHLRVIDNIKKNVAWKQKEIDKLDGEIRGLELQIQERWYQVSEAQKQGKNEFDETKFCIPKRKI